MKPYLLPQLLLLFFVIDAWSQWESIPDVNIICNDAVLYDSANIWGVGNIGQTFRYSYSDIDPDFEYRQFSDNLNFNKVIPGEDSILIMGGLVYDSKEGFLLFYAPDYDTINHMSYFPNCINDVLFSTRDTGYTTSFNGIHKTVDGGNTWDNTWDFASIGANYGELFSLAIDSKGGIYASGIKQQDLGGPAFQGVIIKSEDHGESWQLVFERDDGRIYNLDFRHDVIYCNDSEFFSIYTSENFGASWNQIDIPVNNPLLKIHDVTFLKRSQILACITQAATLEKSQNDIVTNMIINSPDNGKTWYIQHESYPPRPPIDTTLNAFVNVNDTLVYAFGWHFGLRTENSGGEGGPILSLKANPVMENVKLYPMPVLDRLFVEGFTDVDQCVVFNLLGQLVSRKPIKYSDPLSISLKGLEPGSYILEFRNNHSLIYSTLILKN